MHLTDERRALLEQYLRQMDVWREKSLEAEVALCCAETFADKLIETFRGENIPEVIVFMGRVVEINRALLATDHARPHQAVREVRDAVVEGAA